MTAVPANEPLKPTDPTAQVAPDQKMRRRVILFIVLSLAVAAFVAYAVVLTGNLEFPLVGALIIVMMYGLVRLPKPKRE